MWAEEGKKDSERTRICYSGGMAEKTRLVQLREEETEE